MPWFHVHTLTLTQTLTLTNSPNHTLTLTRFQTLTQPRNETPSSRLAENWSRDHLKSSFSPITPQGCIFTLRHAGWFGISVKNTSKPIFKYPKCSNIRIFENSLVSDLVLCLPGLIILMINTFLCNYTFVGNSNYFLLLYVHDALMFADVFHISLNHRVGGGVTKWLRLITRGEGGFGWWLRNQKYSLFLQIFP